MKLKDRCIFKLRRRIRKKSVHLNQSRLVSPLAENLKEWGSCTARRFQCSGEIDAVEGIALAIGKVVGGKGRQLAISDLNNEACASENS